VTVRIALVAVLGLAGCISGRDCVNAIPGELRADAIRYALDAQLVGSGDIPDTDHALALGAGTPIQQLTDARKAQLARYVAGYADCVKDRIHRGK
jgi:hypothetical protein